MITHPLNEKTNYIYRPGVPGFSADSLKNVEELESPRIIKTHLSMEMLPRQVIVKMKSMSISSLWTGDGKKSKTDLRDKEPERCRCVLFQPLEGTQNIHQYSFCFCFSNPRPFDPRGISKLSSPILLLARWWLDTLVPCLLWWMPSLMVVDPRYCIKAKELLYQVLLGTTPLSCRMYCPTGTPDMRKIYSSSLSKRWSLTLLAWWTGWPPFWARVSLRSRFFHGSPDMINNCHLQSF